MNLPGGGEWIIVLLIVLLLFGAKKLPDLANSMGKSIKEFKKASEDEDAAQDETTGSTGPTSGA